MPNLDPVTLALVSAMAAFFMAVTMAGFFIAGNREGAVADWALAGLLFCVGHLLAFVALGEATSGDQRMALAVANTTVMLGYNMVILGLQRHLGIHRWMEGLFLLAVAVGVAIAFVPIMHESTVFRVLVLTGVYTGLSAAGAYLLWRTDDRDLLPYRRAVGAVLIANALILILRATYFLASERITFELSEPIILVPIYLSAFLFYTALNISLALLLFRQKAKRLDHLARHDSLTGLLNRHALEHYSGREMARARQGDQALSLVLLDLDGFSQLKNRRGQAIGDQVLLQSAERIRRAIREGDAAFRTGDEKFLMLLPGADQTQAERIAERLRSALSDHPFICQGGVVSLSASIGWITHSPACRDWDDLLRQAERAVYEARGRGGNRVEQAPGDDPDPPPQRAGSTS
jgi:diguanylate cyclase (GGDEF)-like protein